MKTQQEQTIEELSAYIESIIGPFEITYKKGFHGPRWNLKGSLDLYHDWVHFGLLELLHWVKECCGYIERNEKL